MQILVDHLIDQPKLITRGAVSRSDNHYKHVSRQRMMRCTIRLV